MATELKLASNVVGVKMGNFYEYDPDIPLPYDWDHPAGVPKTYEELEATHRQLIERVILRYNKVKRNFDDLYQGVWIRFMESGIINKFVEGAARRLPLTMRAYEAVQFLGLRWEQWVYFLRRDPLAMCVDPQEGDRFAMHAVWESSSVCEFDYEGLKGKKRPLPRKRPPITSRGFKTYIQQAAHNAFANQCRTVDRRYKEQTLTPGTILRAQSDGSFKRAANTEDFSSWETNIAAAMTDEEALLDLRTKFRKINFDPNSVQGVKVIDFMVQQGKVEDGPRRNIELLSLIGQGYTLSEAARKVRHRATVRNRHS